MNINKGGYDVEFVEHVTCSLCLERTHASPSMWSQVLQIVR